MAGLGPMEGQNSRFLFYAPKQIPYALNRYGKEVARLYGAPDRQLSQTSDCIAGAYSIADVACFPWIMTHKAQGLSLDVHPNLKRWFATLRTRKTLQSGLAVGKKIKSTQMNDAMQRRLYGISNADEE